MLSRGVKQGLLIKSHIFRTLTGLLFALALSLLPQLSAAQERRLPFLTDETIEEVREKIRLNGYSFTVEENRFTSMIQDELQSFRGRRRSEAQLKATSYQAPPRVFLKTTGLPSSFDLRNVGGKSYIGPVKDQGTAGTCFAFGAAAAAEASFNYATGRYGSSVADFSESYIAWSLPRIVPYAWHFDGDYGADYDYYELEALTDPGQNTGREGICDESSFPYQDRHVSDAQISASWSKPRTLFPLWGRVFPFDYAATTDEIKAAIYTYGAVDAAVLVTTAFSGYSGGIFDDVGNSTPDTDPYEPYYYSTTNHAIALVGWEDNPGDGGDGYWILRNSWGSDWGEGGYMRIRYSAARVNTAAAFLAYSDSLPRVEHYGVADISGEGAVINGGVNPNNHPTTYKVEYGMTQSYGSFSSVSSLPAGSSFSGVQIPITGLRPQTTIHFRIVAENQYGTYTGPDLTFVTVGDTPLPVITGVAVGEVTAEVGADIAWRVNGGGSETSCLVEYGTDGLFDYSTDCSEIWASTDFEEGGAWLGDLIEGTTYNFRIVMTNGAGSTVSESGEFTVPIEVLYEGFESFMPPYGWTEQVVSANGGTAPDWSQRSSNAYFGAEPLATPYFSSRMAAFNSYQTWAGNEARLVSPALDLSSRKNTRLTVRVYNDLALSNQDYLRIQASADGLLWTNQAEKCQRYTGTRGWSECVADLSFYDGKPSVYVSLLGHSDWGSNLLVDHLSVTALEGPLPTPTPSPTPTRTPTPSPTVSLPVISGSVSGAVISGVTVKAGPVTAVTDSLGAFRLGNLNPGIYTIIPGLNGYHFSPESMTMTVNLNDQAAVYFSSIKNGTLGPALTAKKRSLKAVISHPAVPVPLKGKRVLRYELSVEVKKKGRFVPYGNFSGLSRLFHVSKLKAGEYRIRYRSAVYEGKKLLKKSALSRPSTIKVK